MNKYPEIVEKIHSEFNTASEVLLNEAKEVLAKCEQQDSEKVDLLLKVGFRNTPEALRAKQIAKERKPYEEQMRTVQYYATRYPNNKFITEKQVEAICKKYNLVCGPISVYKGFVPMEKLKAIADFRLYREQDQANDLIRVTECRSNNIFLDSKKRGAKEFRRKYGEYIDSSFFHISIYGAKYNPQSIFIDSYDKVDRSKPFICAPEKDMDLKNTKSKGFFRFMTTHVEVPDPVVLQPVQGGYLILAAWGDEASDEIVVNQTMN